MPRLSTGLVIAGAYADKVRRTLFAQLSGLARRDREWSRRIAYAAAQLNVVLYRILVERLGIEKGDVVRVQIDYDVDEETKRVEWRWDTLRIEAFRRVPEEQIEEAVRSVLSQVEAPSYDVELVGETMEGDRIYAVKIGDEVVGAAKVIEVDGRELVQFLVLTIPEPIVVRRAPMPLRDLLNQLQTAPNLERVEYAEAQRLVEKLLSSVQR